MKKILFVCLGNICRSPMAEALFRQRITETGQKDQFQVDSAGTSDWEEGNPPHPQTRLTLQNHNVSTANLISRPVTTDDFYKFDVIIGMDHKNVQDLEELRPKDSTAKIYLFMSVLPTHSNADVPDPWYTHKFEAAYQQIAAGIDEWVTFLTAHNE
ncbi:low molecular weight phosphotyrosine protein phosphatase [Pediococcus ethanolidurans]|uniref:low molecular weight protein-tyrosine-phosphatase n=1 Tax=Pediococcus ethanolidurans TaxID=319653 RepID=UPI0021AA09CB|nr:low molecular weight protein-tyrosine-phosphatase [Pediococcus ethanolidurans]MCT4398468.1 low molecular weight phosphotyrosine protein phosphatase [Pediococcus ethanolidurans]